MTLKKIDLPRNEYVLIRDNVGGITYDKYNSDHALIEHLGFTAFTDETYWRVNQVFEKDQKEL